MYVGGLLAPAIVSATKVHVVQLMEDVLTGLVSCIGVVPQFLGHQHAQFFIICVGLVHGAGITILDRPLESLEGFSGQAFSKLFKYSGVVPSAIRGTLDYSSTSANRTLGKPDTTDIRSRILRDTA